MVSGILGQMEYCIYCRSTLCNPHGSCMAQYNNQYNSYLLGLLNGELYRNPQNNSSKNINNQKLLLLRK